jgi:citronellol/citronellal dehydrogenase
LATALEAARDGAKIAIAAKTVEPHPKLPETIYTAAEKVRAAGAAEVLAIQCDIRSEESVRNAVDTAVTAFGGIDILINNASAIMVLDTESINMKQFDLCHGVTVRGTFMVTKYAVPHLLKSSHAHILNMSPPITTRA